MKKIQLKKNMMAYQFDPSEGGLGTNILALHADEAVLLIDAGYAQHMQAVLEDLKGKKVTTVIPSHFHPDHIEGIQLLDHPVVYGNAWAKHSVEEFYDKERELYQPTYLLTNESRLSFGSFDLQFKDMPGHSDCSCLIIIDGEYVHVGDLYMTTNDGKDVLPYVSWADVKKHLDALEYLKSIRVKMLFSHGEVVLEPQEMKRGLEDRCRYFEKLLKTDNTCSEKEAVEDCKGSFEMLHWRQYVK